ncbi:MAG: trypsin-like peptidase domain-containing protein [Acidimicrobiia bacterium]
MGSESAEEPGEPEEQSSGPRPDPFDRTWVHPSELHSFVATPDAPSSLPRPREWVIGVTSAIAGVVAAVLVLVAFGAIGSRNRSIIKPPVVSQPNQAIDFSVAQTVYSSVAASIVTVQITGSDPAKPTIGSGVVMRSNRVVTAAHLLTGATAVSVQTREGRSITAKLLGTDPDTDLAVLDVTGAGLSFAVLGSDTEPTLGQPVVAVGAGKGNEGWFGLGILNQRNQLWGAPSGSTVAGLLVAGIPTPPENVGGALLDTTGRVVGILANPLAGASTGLVLAVPIAVARDVENQLDASGQVQHGYLGVAGEDAKDRVGGGARITLVVPGSAAEKAKEVGLLPNDVVTRVGNTTIRTYGDLVAEWRRRRVGDSMSITFWRGDDSRTITATLGAVPGSTPPG